MGQLCSENRGLPRAGDVLRETHGEFVVSRYRIKQADGIALVRANRESGQQSIAFTSRPFILCGLPVRKCKRPVATALIRSARADPPKNRCPQNVMWTLRWRD